MEEELSGYEVTNTIVRRIPRFEEGEDMNPISFIRSYEEEIAKVPAKGFNEDQLCRKLFPFALGYEPRIWIARLALGSLKTWSQVVEEFLARFMPYHETIALRNRSNTSIKENTSGSVIPMNVLSCINVSTPTTVSTMGS